MKYRAIISDFDDTLRRDDGTVSVETLQAIKKFEEMGGFFAICSGRMISSARKEALENGLSGYVMGYQGGVLCEIESGKVLIDERMETDIAVEILKEFEKLKYPIHIYDGDRYMVNNKTKYTVSYEEACKVTAEDVNEVLSEYVEKNKLRLNKILMIIEPEKSEEYISRFSEKFKEMHVICSRPFFVEVTTKKANKGEMAKTISERLNIQREELICIGDGRNDISMIKFAGLGVSVENACQQLKEVSQYITKSNNEDGVRDVIVKVIANAL